MRNFRVEVPEEYPKYHEKKRKLEDLMKGKDFLGLRNVSEKTREEFEKNLGRNTVEERMLTNNKVTPLIKRREKSLGKLSLIMTRWLRRRK